MPDPELDREGDDLPSFLDPSEVAPPDPPPPAEPQSPAPATNGHHVDEPLNGFEPDEPAPRTRVAAALRETDGGRGAVSGAMSAFIDREPLIEALLGEIIISDPAQDAAALRWIFERFSAGDLEGWKGEVFLSLRRVWERGEPLDIVSLRNELRAVVREDWGVLLGRLMAQAVTAANLRHHARIVLELTLDRDESMWAQVLGGARSKRERERCRLQLEHVTARRAMLSAPEETETDPAEYDLDRYLHRDLEPVDEFVPGIFARGTVNIVFGSPGSAKSWALMALGVDLAAPAWSVATFLGREVERRHDDRCLWVFGSEDPMRRPISRSAKLWRSGPAGIDFEGHVIPEPDDPKPGVFRLRGPRTDLETRTGQLWLRREVERMGCTMLVVDTVTSTTTGLRPSKGEDVTPFLKFFHQLRDELGVTVFLVSHTRKRSLDSRGRPVEGSHADSLLGAQEWRSMSDGLLMLDARDGDTRHIDVRVLKAKDIEETMPPRTFELDKDQGRLFEVFETDDPDEVPARAGIRQRTPAPAAPRDPSRWDDPWDRRKITPTAALEAARKIPDADKDADGWFDRRAWEKALGVSETTFRRALRAGLIEDLVGTVEERPATGPRPSAYRLAATTPGA